MTAALRDIGGIHVEIATTDIDGPTNRLRAAELPKGSVPVMLFPARGGNPLEKNRPMADWLAAHSNEYNIVHIHSVWSVDANVAARAAETAAVPYVLSSHGMLSEYSWARHPWKKRLYWWAAQRRTIRRAAAFHVTSPTEVTEVKACGVTVPVVEIPLGMEPEAFHNNPPRPNWLRERCGPNAGNRPIILFLSRLHPKKGVLDILLPAFSCLKTDAFLAIAGGVDESTPGYPDEIRRAIDRYKLGDRISVIGPVAPADRWAAFDGAALFCLPSYNENFGVVVTESMARGCPVVVTLGVAAGAHAVAAGCGVVVPRTTEAVATALDTMLAESNKKEFRAAAGRDYVRTKLSWEGFAQHLVDLYKSVLKKPSTSNYDPVATTHA